MVIHCGPSFILKTHALVDYLQELLAQYYLHKIYRTEASDTFSIQSRPFLEVKFGYFSIGVVFFKIESNFYIYYVCKNMLTREKRKIENYLSISYLMSSF